MRTRIEGCIIAALVVAIAMAGSAHAIALAINADSANYSRGSNVTLYGTAAVGSWVALQVNDPSVPIIIDTAASNSTGGWNYKFKIGPNATGGTYTAYASHGIEKVSTTFIVTVPVPPDFTISISPSSASVQQGYSRTIDVTVTYVGGYNKTVNVSVGTLPSGVTVSPMAWNATATATTTMTTTVAASTVTGIYNIVITGAGADNRTRSATFALTVTEGGGGCDGTCPQPCTVSTLVAGSATLAISSASAGGTVTCYINNPSLIGITQLNVTFSTAVSNARIDIREGLPAGFTALTNGYKYFNITSNVAGSIANVGLNFAVNKSWVAAGNYTAVSAYRYDGGWGALSTSRYLEDASYIRYMASASGFGIFSIAGVRACPACPAAGAWSTCAAGADGRGSRSRSAYNCSAATNYQCTPTTETEVCCPSCPAAGAWSACTAGRQSRAVWTCSATTNYACTESLEERSCVIAADAAAAISTAQSAIQNASASGCLNASIIENAQSLLSQAQSANVQGDYATAKSRADQARAVAETSCVLPPFPWLMVIAIIAIAAAAGGGFYFFYKKRMKPRPTICYICREPTTLRVRCSVCGKYVCVKHGRMVAGKPYCVNHLPRGPPSPGAYPPRPGWPPRPAPQPAPRPPSPQPAQPQRRV